MAISKLIKELRLFALLLFIAGLPRVGLAQTAGSGALAVTVTDPTGALVPGANVRVANAATAFNRGEKTGSNGSYTFGLLPPGEYSVTISAQGFGSIEIPAVTVQTEVQAVQTENATLGDVVGNRAINDLPLVKRNFHADHDALTGRECERD
jgi:hypothetical protein